MNEKNEKYGTSQVILFFLVGIALTLSILSYANSAQSTQWDHKSMMKDGTCPMMSGKMSDMKAMHESGSGMMGDSSVDHNVMHEKMHGSDSGMMGDSSIDHNAMHEMMEEMMGGHFEEKHHEQLHDMIDSTDDMPAGMMS